MAMAVETEQRIAQLAERVFRLRPSTKEEVSSQSDKQPTKVAQKLSEPRSVSNGRTIVEHFFSLVPTHYGSILRFHDAGSRALRIRTYPKVREEDLP